MKGLNALEVLTYVVRPALDALSATIPRPSRAADQLVIGTALVESGLAHIDQVDPAGKPGPAYGPWQIERLTFNDHWARAAAPLHQALYSMSLRHGLGVSELHGNLFLGAALCRVIYWHSPDLLPVQGDYAGMARLWKRRYNTYLGAGTVEKATPFFKQACEL